MKLKNKIFLIFSIFLCIVSIFITFSQASYDFEFEGEKYTLPDFPDDGNSLKFVFTDFVGSIKSVYLYTSNEPVYFYNDFNSVSLRIPAHKEYSCRLDLLNGNFSFAGDSPDRPISTRKLAFERIVYSNYDIYNKDSGELVFQKAPLAQMVEPMKVGKVEELPTLIIQIVEMIIPAFLIIFGTLLVLYLIKSKNLLQL